MDHSTSHTQGRTPNRRQVKRAAKARRLAAVRLAYQTPGTPCGPSNSPLGVKK